MSSLHNASRHNCVFCGHTYSDIERSTILLRDMKRLQPRLSIVLVSTSAAARPAFDQFRDVFDHHVEDENLRAEFGAYQAGLDLLLKSGSEGRRGVIFANDTIWKKSIDRALLAVTLGVALSSLADRALLFGQRDSFRIESYAINGVRGNCWISTHFFFASEPLLARLNHQVCYDLLGELDNRSPTDCADRPIEDSFFGDLDEQLAHDLGAWLFRGGWHGSGPLSAANYTSFRGKLRSIMNEIYLGLLADQERAILDHRDVAALLRGVMALDDIDLPREPA